MVTHEPSVAAYASRVVVLRDGRLADDFAVGELDPSGRLVAERYRAGAKAA